ncbi:CinA family protein [Blastococcus saxobsidens]|uniref:CinA family protein n=1 Tax=Blastococcus saxobsidens TaxID=138336 RepID=UPI0031F2E75F
MAASPDLAALAGQVHRALLARRETVAAAESLTAGLLCAALASVPGASATLRGGAVVYATDLKATLAGVPEGVLAEHGPVSPQTAAALAEGIRLRCGADWGVGLTGVAGPDPVDGHGPGRVYLGTSDGERTDVAQLDLPGGRADVRSAAVASAFRTLLERLAGKPSSVTGVTP